MEFRDATQRPTLGHDGHALCPGDAANAGGQRIELLQVTPATPGQAVDGDGRQFRSPDVDRAAVFHDALAAAGDGRRRHHPTGAAASGGNRLPPGSGRGDPLSDTQRQRELPLPRHPDYRLVIFYTDTLASDVHSLRATAPVSVALGLIIVFLFLALCWLRRQIQPQESLETRARRIIYGERDNVGEQPDEMPSLTGSAIDRLLRDLAQAREQRSRVDILIRAFAAHDARTGLTNRLSFESQLALQLEDNQDLVSVSLKHYPDALLAHYFRDDLAVLLPHRSLKEAESLTQQLLSALATLPDIPATCRDELLHIGVSAYRPPGRRRWR